MKVVQIILLSMSVASCSFSGVFFPLDTRPKPNTQTNVEQIRLNSFDDTLVNHYLFKTDQVAKSTIFVLQGSGSTVHHWYKVITPLLKQGHQVFMMEYRGFANSDGEATHINVAKDTINALKYLKTREDIQGLPLLLMGHSYGGQPAIYAAAKLPQYVDALIVEGTFSSFSEEAAYSAPWFVSPVVELIVKDSYKASELIQSIEVPVLVIHSVDDKVVPFDMANTLVNNSSADLWKITGKHVAGLVEQPENYLAKVENIVEEVTAK